MPLCVPSQYALSFSGKGELVRKMKEENSPAQDLAVAVKELKIRKKALENKVDIYFNVYGIHFFAHLLLQP